jgi:hypothetical protein
MSVKVRVIDRWLPVALLLGLSGAASASTIAAGTVPFGFSGLTASSTTLTPGTSFTVGAISASSNGTGSFDCTVPGTNSVCNGYSAILSPNPFTGNLLVGETLIFDAGPANGTLVYKYVVTGQTAPQILSLGTQTFYTIDSTGTFSDLRGTPVFTTNDASLSIIITQNCSGANCSLSGGASFATPPAASANTPEPGTRALFLGSALVGLSCLNRKRRRRAS